MFRITDLPSLMSGSIIVYLDPRCVVRPSRLNRIRHTTLPPHVSSALFPDLSAATPTGRAIVPRESTAELTARCGVSPTSWAGAWRSLQYAGVLVRPVQNLPGVSSAAPGKRIDFAAFPVLQQFPDQFEPYRLFGCTMEVRVNTHRSTQALQRRSPLSMGSPKKRSPGLGGDDTRPA